MNTSPVPQIHDGLKGRYQVLVTEPNSLPTLRVRAAREVGYSLDLGTATEWLSLPKSVRERADQILSDLVATGSLEQEECSTVYARPEENNLILDQGLDQVASQTYANLGYACAIGTGTDATYRDSGAITVTVSGSTATASSGFFVAGDIGRLLLADNGASAYITGYTSSTIVTLGGTPTISGQLFTLWYVNQTGLSSEVQRATTYLTGAGNTGSSRASNVLTWKWTYDARVESSNQNYSELGFSCSDVPGNNLWARTLIGGGTVSVLIGQRLRVVYRIVVTITPTTATAGTSTITGWATDQTGNYQLIGTAGSDTDSVGFRSLDTNGSPGPYSTLDPSANVGLALATNTTIPAFGSTGTITGQVSSNTHSLDTYTYGTFQRTKSSTWNLSTANGTTWRSIFFISTYGPAWQWCWNSNQTKDSLHTLTLTVLHSWSRTLTNP